VAHDHYIELVGKVVRVADTLQNEPDGLSLQDLAARTGFAKSSLHRILHSLRRHGYIEQDGNGAKYRLGTQILVLASGMAARIELVKMARPFLHDLVSHFRESAYLAVLRGGRGVFVDVEEAPGNFRLVGPLGAEVHFHATAAGKAMAAHFSEEQRAAILRTPEFRGLTANTITKPSDITREWALVRRRGYAINDEETIAGAVFLGAALFDARDRVCGSISVGVPKVRLSAELSKHIATRLKDDCRRLSEKLKATGYVHVTGSYVGHDPNTLLQERQI
jgi:IclR family transcriptional regulator, KDG regulon repressor